MARESPTQVDPVAAAMSEVIGGPMGDHAAGHRWWSASRALVAVTTLVLAGGMVSKSACVPSGWSKDTQPFAQLCWTELAGVSPEKSRPPHVTTYLERLAAAVPGHGTVAAVAALAVLLAVLALVATTLLVRVDHRRPWAAAGWASAPVLLFHWLSWDLVAAVAIAIVLWGWTTGRPWLAGVAAGVGAAFALPVAAALAGVIAVGGRNRDRVVALGAAGAAYVVVSLPGRARVEDLDVGSIWRLLQSADPGLPSRNVRFAVALVVLVLAVGAVAWLLSRSPGASPMTAARAGLVALAAVLLVARSVPPESALLLLPLAAIAVRRWRDLLVWQGCELVSWVLTGWYLGDALVPTVNDDSRAYSLAIMLRLVGLGWLLVAVLRDASSGDDDVVEVGRRETHADRDVLPDAGHPSA